MSGYPSNTPIIPTGSDDPRKQAQQPIESSDRGLKIGNYELSNQQLGLAGGLLGTAAAIGIGAFAIDKYHDSKENKAEIEWGAQNWEQEAHRRQGQYLEAIKENKPLPPLTWVLTEGNSIPQGAIVGGQESDGTPLYIARAYYQQGVHIGKVSAKLKDGCRIPYGGKELSVQKYEILLGYQDKVRWVDAEGKLRNTQSYKLVEGGREADGTPLYIGQAHLHGSVVPGKVGEQIEGCLVPYDGDEKKEKHYRFLVEA